MLLYCIEAVGGDAVKIGVTRDRATLRVRLAGLQSGNHCTLRVLGTLRLRHGSSERVEAAVHHRLRAGRLVGEWFRLSSHSAEIRRWFAGRSPLPREPPPDGPNGWKKARGWLHPRELVDLGQPTLGRRALAALRGGPLRCGQLRRLLGRPSVGTLHDMLAKLVHRGTIVRIRRGVYGLVDEEST